MKHTPGLWAVIYEDGRWSVRTSDDRLSIAVIGRREAAANARLIAAAPAMLQVLKTTREYLHARGIDSSKLDTVIGKAEGAAFRTRHIDYYEEHGECRDDGETCEACCEHRNLNDGYCEDCDKDCTEDKLAEVYDRAKGRRLYGRADTE